MKRKRAGFKRDKHGGCKDLVSNREFREMKPRAQQRKSRMRVCGACCNLRSALEVAENRAFIEVEICGTFGIETRRDQQELGTKGGTSEHVIEII